jgi:hypothetical protein
VRNAVRDEDLVADRFFLDADGRGRDLASGRHVAVVQRAIVRRWRDWECARIDEWLDAASGRLVDFGRTGAHGWFEARLMTGRLVATDVRAAARIASVIACAVSAGASHVDVGSGTRRAMAALFIAARALRLAGYVPVRASLPVPSAIERAVRHRHLGFLLCGERDSSPAAACWWRAASIAPRHHLVVDCGRQLHGRLRVDAG